MLARPPRPRVLALAALVLALRVPAAGQATYSLLDVSSAGTQADADSIRPRLSADGRYACFESNASNLVPGLINLGHVFVRDRQAGTTSIESVSTTGKKGNFASTRPDISGDGRYVVFESLSTNLVAPDFNGVTDVFLRDRQLGTTELISVSLQAAPGNGASRWASVSDDGRYVAFESHADDLVAGDGNGATDVFLRDRASGTTTLVSVTPGGGFGVQGGFEPRLSADGRCVAFLSIGLDLVGLSTVGHAQVLVRDLLAGVTTHESVNLAGEPADSTCWGVGLSTDGAMVVFASGGANLVLNDTNMASDVFVRDRTSHLTLRVSVTAIDPLGELGAGTLSSVMAISGDGSRVAYDSRSNLAVPGGDSPVNVYAFDLVTELATRISESPAGGNPNSNSLSAALTRDGATAAFQSGATDLVADANGPMHDVLAREIGTSPWSWRGHALAGGSGFALLHAQGTLLPGSSCAMAIAHAAPSAPLLIFVSLAPASVPFKGGTLVAAPFVLAVPFVTSASGELQVPLFWPTGIPGGTSFTVQAALLDAGAPAGVALTNAIQGTAP